MLSPTTKALERDVRAWVAAGSGLEGKRVLRGKDRGIGPAEPYATVLLITQRPEGQAWVQYEPSEDVLLDATTVSSDSYEYSVQWFRTSARDRGRRFRLWAESPAGIIAAAERGLTLYRSSELRQLNEVLSEEWEERAGLELLMGHLSTVTSPVGIVEGIDIGVTSEADEEIVKIDITNAPSSIPAVPVAPPSGEEGSLHWGGDSVGWNSDSVKWE